ncbi:hypothetical protein KAU11_03170, partial [Candidatus Babeliales bacterium]|nr:hypothetical protein [Candidatus Babeliales bacterium]
LVWKNPDNVFYLRGNHEAHDYWQGYGLKRELKLRAGHLKTVDDKIPLRPLVRKFFKTLPIVMYFAMPHDDDREFVRFSHEGGNEFKVVELDESKYDDFLQQPSHGKIGTFHMEGLEADNSRLIELQAIIRAEVKRKSYQANDGLRLIAPEEGVTSWTLLSCPTEVYRKGLKFYNDAFGLIEAAQNEKDWKITLYKQDIRTRDGFKLRSHYLLSGSEVDKGDRSERLLATFKARQKEIQKTGMSHGEDEITFVSKEPDFGKKPVPVTKAAVSKLDNKRKIGQATIFSGAESKVFDIAMKCRIISEKAKEKELNLECQVVTPPSRKRAVPRPPRLERRVRRSIGGYTSRVEELPSQFMPPHRPGRQTALNKRVKAPEPPPAPSSIRSMSPTVERLQRQQTRPTRKEMVIEEFNGVLEEQLPDKPIVEPEKIPLAVDI